jgi:hypothetical protein
MGFFEKLKSAIRKIKTKLIVYAILVVIIIIMLVAPLTTSIINAETAAGVKFSQNPFDSDLWQVFFTSIAEGIVTPLTQVAKCFSEEYFITFFGGVKFTLGVALLFALIGIIKAFPKHEYQDIENGSSDWSENGEQYKVLSKNKGIVLAEKNYLPVDKRGNVNVLVVRRFWCW